MATHSSILPWRNPQTEEPGRLQSKGSQRLRHNLLTKQQHELQGIKGSSFVDNCTQSPGLHAIPTAQPCISAPLAHHTPLCAVTISSTCMEKTELGDSGQGYTPCTGSWRFKGRRILVTSDLGTGTPSLMSRKVLAHTCAPDDTMPIICAHCQLHWPLF